MAVTKNEKPILFSSSMIRAILEGSKTQTRRILNPQPMMVADKATVPWDGPADALLRLMDQTGRKCPYGQTGERLWVRETFADIGPRLTYKADIDDGAHCKVKRWTPSIHMFRWASRINLEITGVRVERLNGISEADALAEGIDRERLAEGQDSFDVIADANMVGRPTPVSYYRDLWESINGHGSWDANPWVWIVEFRRITAEDKPAADKEQAK